LAIQSGMLAEVKFYLFFSLKKEKNQSINIPPNSPLSNWLDAVQLVNFSSDFAYFVLTLLPVDFYVDWGVFVIFVFFALGRLFVDGGAYLWNMLLTAVFEFLKYAVTRFL